MDVELPDGSVIQGVPEGTTQQQLLRKLFDAKHPGYQALATQMMKDAPWGSGLPKVAYAAGGKVTDMASAAGASPEVAAGGGYLAHILTEAIPALVGNFRLGDAPASLLEKPAKILMQSAVKPAQADRISGAASRAYGNMLAEDISPTVGGMDKAADIARNLHSEVEGSIAGSPATVSMNAVGQRLQDPARKALTQVNPQSDIEAVRAVWDKFKNSPLIQALSRNSNGTPNVPAPLGAAPAMQDVDLPVQLAHALKKGTYRSLGEKAYGELGSASTEAQKALARGLREEVAGAVPQVAAPLKREAALMEVLDVARNRALAEANKNPMGLAALRLGDNPLSVVGTLADRSAYLKGLAARLLYRGGQPQFLPAYGAAVEAPADRMRE